MRRTFNFPFLHGVHVEYKGRYLVAAIMSYRVGSDITMECDSHFAIIALSMCLAHGLEEATKLLRKCGVVSHSNFHYSRYAPSCLGLL